jgi:hypothetical protein
VKRIDKRIRENYSLTIYSLALGGVGFKPLRTRIFLTISGSILSGTGA